MLRESPRLPAHACDTADWLHVGVYLAWPGHVVLRFPGSAADAELERTLAARGVRLVDTPPLELPASAGRHRTRDPGLHRRRAPRRRALGADAATTMVPEGKAP